MGENVNQLINDTCHHDAFPCTFIRLKFSLPLRIVCYLCSPGQTVFIEEHIQIMGQRSILYLCESFCNRLYQKCALVPVTGGRPVSLAFSSGEDFCTRGLEDPANQLQIKVRTGNCFNGASALGMNWSQMVLVSMMVIVSLLPLFINN